MRGSGRREICENANVLGWRTILGVFFFKLSLSLSKFVAYLKTGSGMREICENANVLGWRTILGVFFFQIKPESFKVRGLFKDKMAVAYTNKPEPLLRS